MSTFAQDWEILGFIKLFFYVIELSMIHIDDGGEGVKSTNIRVNYTFRI